MALTSLVLPGLRRPDVAPEHREQQRSKNVKARTKSGNTSYPGDPHLVAACLKGDRAAWNELVERYQWLVYSVPRRYGLDKADAEDVLQNVFLIVYRRLDTLRDQSRLSSWLIRIAHRETLHYLNKGRLDGELDAELRDNQDPPTEQIERLEAQHSVRQALERLEPNCRAMLEMFLSTANPSYEEVAARLGCPLGSIGPNRARCFKKLEAVLREMGVDVAM